MSDRSGDEDIDTLTELLSNRVLGDCGRQQARRLHELKVDLAKRGVLGSGIEEDGKVRIAIEFMDQYAERMRQELLEVVRKAHGSLDPADAAWIKGRIERDLDHLKTGQAGCYVTTADGQRRLGDWIQRRKAGLASAIEIELRMDALESRGEAGATSDKGAVGGLRTDGAAVTGVPYAFFCHADKDAAVSEPLVRDLVKAGVEVWYDEWEIRPGDSLRRKIDAGIEAATHFLVLLTPASLQSEWVQTELDAGMVKRISGKCRLVPILAGLSGDDVPATLRGVVWVRLDPYAEGLRKLIDACYEVSRKPPLGPAPVHVRERPLAKLGLSTDAQRIAAWINRHSELGLVYDYFERDTLMNELGLSADQAGMAASELSDSGYVELHVDSGSGPAGFSQVAPTPELFIKTDPFLRGWDPERDAVELAAAMVNRARDGVAALADVDKHLGWGPRRLNPAADFLRVYGMVRASDEAGSSPYTYSYAFVDHRTRRFALAGSSSEDA